MGVGALLLVILMTIQGIGCLLPTDMIVMVWQTSATDAYFPRFAPFGREIQRWSHATGVMLAKHSAASGERHVLGRRRTSGCKVVDITARGITNLDHVAANLWRVAR
jgi:hypothetical protein